MAAKRSEEPDMSTIPIDTLELRALEQRGQLHRTTSDLRAKLSRTREKLSISKQTHAHVLSFSLAAVLVGVASGYGVAGLFRKNR